MKIAKTKLTSFNDTLSMMFDGDVVNFNMHDVVIPTYNFSMNCLNTINPLI